MAGPCVNSEFAYPRRPGKSNSATLEEARHAMWEILMAGGYCSHGMGSTYQGGINYAGDFNGDAEWEDRWIEQIMVAKTIMAISQWWQWMPADEKVATDGTAYCMKQGTQYLVYTKGATQIDLPAGNYTSILIDPRTGIEVESATSLQNPPDTQDWVILATRVGTPPTGPPDAHLCP